jgi:hypothetical protein
MCVERRAWSVSPKQSRSIAEAAVENNRTAPTSMSFLDVFLEGSSQKTKANNSKSVSIRIIKLQYALEG